MNRFGFVGKAEVVAHRGFSARAPENTLAALSAAMEAGADAVEFDLQVSGDGVPVLFHDDSLDRTTNGTGTVADHSMEELRGLDAGSWFDRSFAGEPIPELAEALALLEAWPGRVYPELKDPTPLAHVDRIVAEVVSRGFLERTVFITMDWSLLERVRWRAPKAGIGYIVRRASQTEGALVRASGDRLALLDFEKTVALRDRDATARARALGIPMAAWTVDDPKDATRLVEAGVERITTNRVDRMVAWKAEQAP